MPTPKGYEWIDRVGVLPLTISTGLKLVGTIETPGAGNNPTIMAWAKETGLARVYTADSVPWCGLFAAVVCMRAGKPVPEGPLWALNWAKVGEKAGQPVFGDVLVFVRPGGGHVGFYVGEDSTHYHVLGGNQSDKVSIARVAKSQLRSARRLPFKSNLPASAKPYVLKGTAPALSDGQMA